MNMLRPQNSVKTGSSSCCVEEAQSEYIDLREEYMEYESLTQSNGFSNIGNGVSGIVSKAFHYKSGRMVALKHCRSRQLQETAAFRREAALYRKFGEHPQIVNMHQFACDIDSENLCIAMEYMDMGSTDTVQMDNLSTQDKE